MRVIQMDPSSKPSQNSFPPPISAQHNSENVKKISLDISRFKKDDWILLGIIATLILEGSTDYILICALGYLFLMGL